MPRRPAPVGSALGAAIRAHRGELDQQDAARELGITPLSLSRHERGLNKPSIDTARALARWLGWTVEQVLDAADQPVPSDTPSQSS